MALFSASIALVTSKSYLNLPLLIYQSSQYLLLCHHRWDMTIFFFFTILSLLSILSYSFIFALSSLIYVCSVTRVAFLCDFYKVENKRICIIRTLLNYLLQTQVVSIVTVSQLLWYTKGIVPWVRFKWILFLRHFVRVVPPFSVYNIHFKSFL